MRRELPDWLVRLAMFLLEGVECERADWKMGTEPARAAVKRRVARASASGGRVSIVRGWSMVVCWGWASAGVVEDMVDLVLDLSGQDIDEQLVRGVVDLECGFDF